MPPGGEAPQDIGLDGDQHQPAEHRAAADQGEGGKVAGAEIGDNQKGDEEDGGGAEVAHQGQAAHARAGEQDEQPQVPLAEQALQGGRPGEDVAGLGQFRGLEGESEQTDPVGRTVFDVPGDEGQGEQGDGCRRHEPADLPHPLQVPKKDSGDQEQDDAQQDGQQLLGDGGGGGGGGDRQTQGGEEKGDGLHLKAGAPHAPQDEAVDPHHRSQAQKGPRDQQGMDPLLREQELEAGKQLKQGEQDQGTPGGDGVLGGAAAALRLLVRDGEEHGLHAAQAEYVPQGDGGAAGLHRGPVDSGAAFGVQIVHRPPVVRGADEGGVLPGDHGVVEQHIGGGAAAQDILPVGQGLRGPVGQGEAGPYFRLGRGLDQAADDPHQHQNGQNRKKKAKDQRVPGEQDRVCLRQLPQSVQAGLEGGGQVRQGGPPFE